MLNQHGPPLPGRGLETVGGGLAVDDGALEDEQKAIVGDQVRIRGNISRIARGSDLYNRYIQKLDRQEDRLESLVEAVDGARARWKKAEDAFADYVSKLKV